MNAGRGAGGGACGEFRAGQRDPGLCRRWLKAVSAGSLPLGWDFLFVCFAFPSSCALCFLWTFPVLQTTGNRGRRQGCESEGAGGV